MNVATFRKSTTTGDRRDSTTTGERKKFNKLHTHHLINKIIDKFLKMMKTIIVMSKQNLLLKLFCILLSCIFIANYSYSTSYAYSPKRDFFGSLDYYDKEEIKELAKDKKFQRVVEEHTPEIFEHIRSVEILKILINDFDLNIHATSQSSPNENSLYYARDPMVVKYLFDNGVTDKKAKDEKGKNSLYYAMYRDNYDVAEMLFIKRVSPYTDPEDTSSSIKMVNDYFSSDYSSSREKSDLKELISIFNSGNNDFIKTFVLSKHLLFDAIKRDSYQDVKVVMQNYQLHINDYAPKIFRYIKSVAMLKFLINEFDLDISIEQKELGLNALHYVLLPEVAEYIINNTNLEIDAMTSLNETPLYYAAEDERYGVAKILFEKGACPYIGGSGNNHPIDIMNRKSILPPASHRAGKLHDLFETSKCKPEPKKSFFSKFFDYFK